VTAQLRGAVFSTNALGYMFPIEASCQIAAVAMDDVAAACSLSVEAFLRAMEDEGPAVLARLL